MHKDNMFEKTELKTFYKRSYMGSDLNIVSSADHPYAISDALQRYLDQTKKSLHLSFPWIGKGFIDRVRNLSEELKIRLLTRMPDEDDYRAFRTLESFEEVAKSKGFTLEILCRKYLHLKFCIFDCETVLSGSLNPTNYGEYYNDELLYTFSNPIAVKRHIDIFNKLWYSSRNITWKNVQGYYGYKGSYHKPTHKTIADAVIGFFHISGHREVPKSVLCERISKRIGFNKNDVIEVVKNLLHDGVLYEPRRDYVRIA